MQIVSELITNAVKHAAPSGEGGRIVVRCREDGLKQLIIEVVDDGPGLPMAFTEMKGGLGFRLVRALCKQIAADLEFKSEGPGLCVRLTMPPHPMIAST